MFFDIIDLNLFAALKAVPVDQTTSAQVGQLVTSNPHNTSDLSLFGLFLQASWIIQGIMLFLLACSVWSWTIIFDKLIMLKRVRNHIMKFEKAFWSGRSLQDLYIEVKSNDKHPIANVFAAAMVQWQNKDEQKLMQNQLMRSGVKERIAQAMQVSISRAADGMQTNLNFLATVASTAPFVGLFGTVWGIMISFQSIALSKNTSLAVVAPGIAEALFATAIGLIAAIPAALFYNKFANDINRILQSLEDFSVELLAIMSKELDNMK